MNTIPGAYVIKLFTAVIYDVSWKARVFVPGNSFQSGVLFVSKALKGAPY